MLKAPVLDEELKGVMDSAQTLGPTKGAVHKWDQDADASYEAHMASFRLAHHSSLMATYVDSLATQFADINLTEFAKHHMTLSQELLKSSAYGAASTIHLKRSMALSLTDELRTGPVHDKLMAVPFRGGELFGPGFMEVIEKSSASHEKLASLKAHLKKVKTPHGSRAQASFRGRGRGVMAVRGRGVAAAGSRSATITRASQQTGNVPFQPPFRGGWRGRGGRGGPRGGVQRGTFRGRGGGKPPNKPSK